MNVLLTGIHCVNYMSGLNKNLGIIDCYISGGYIVHNRCSYPFSYIDGWLNYDGPIKLIPYFDNHVFSIDGVFYLCSCDQTLRMFWYTISPMGVYDVDNFLRYIESL